MPRYLVTGGLGFIGSHLVDSLVADGHTVRVIDDVSTGTRDYLPASVELIEADIRTPNIMARTMDGMDGCFHLAAVASVTRCTNEWTQSHLINLGATVNIFEQAAARNIPVVYTSSAAVYGDNPNVPLKETEPVAPISAYGVDKTACEMHAKHGAMVLGLRSIGLRPFNVWGPRQRPGDAYAGVITVFKDRLERGEELVIYGDGNQTRDFIHVSDVVRGFCGAMAALHAQPADHGYAQLINLCTGHELSVIELAHHLASQHGQVANFKHVDERPGEICRSVGSAELGKELLELNARPMSVIP